MQRSSRMAWAAGAGIALALASGCAGPIKRMQLAVPDYAAAPAPGKALVIFMFPGRGAVQSSVFEIRDNAPTLVGVLTTKAKVAYQAEPGKRLFMVVGESGDFMGADLVAGKTYYARVAPRMGVWKARYSLYPVHKAELGGAQLAEWLSDCRWVEKVADSEAWAQENQESIRSKYADYYPKWMEKAEGDRPMLFAEDGK